MPVLVTCKFDREQINNEHAIFPLFSMRNFSSAQRHVTLKRMIQSGWNLNSSEILTPVLDTCMFGKDPIKID